MPSKQIQIRVKRSKSSVMPQFILDDAVARVSSVWKFGAPLRGLTDEEEKKYLPKLSTLDPDSKTWRADANRFWAEMSIKVPSDGTELEIGMTDGSSWPRNLLDYVRYRFCMEHPLVAKSIEELASKATYRFYIHDPEQVVAKSHSSVQLKAEAYSAFSKIKSGKNSDLLFGRILRLNGINPDRMTTPSLETAIANFLEATPAKFIKFAQNKDLEDTALIEELVDQQVLRKLGSIYQFGDIRIGDSLDEAVAYIGSTKNSKHLVTMLSQLEEKRKARGFGTEDLKQRLGVSSPKEKELEPVE